jgi:hypothetical protein
MEFQPVIMSDLKQCTKCKKWLKRNCFRRQNAAPDHLQWYCKPCDNERRYDHRMKNLEHELEREKNYQAERRARGAI